jgi:hypothetical protein
MSRDSFLTSIKPGQTDLQPKERGHAMCGLERSQVDVIVALHPDLAQRLKP